MLTQVRSVESLKREIRELQGALAQNNFELKRLQKRNMWLAAGDLLNARVQIYMSIAHRQGLIIEIQEATMKYVSNEGKVA